MAYIAFFAGSLMAVFILAWVFEKILFQRIFDDPVKGKTVSVAAAWLVTGTIGGFGFADGGPYFWPAFLAYLPAAIVLGLLAYRRGLRIRKENETADAGFADRFA